MNVDYGPLRGAVVTNGTAAHPAMVLRQCHFGELTEAYLTVWSFLPLIFFNQSLINHRLIEILLLRIFGFLGKLAEHGTPLLRRLRQIE